MWKAFVSGFAVVYERSTSPIQPGVFERVMGRLSHRGPDGSDEKIANQIAMGHWHFWTTPEEVGEKQPLELAGMPFRIVLDGRLDNRMELISELNISPAEGKLISDAALVLHAYDRWGEHCFEHFVGPFALVIWDEHHHELLFARDALGDRTLFFSCEGSYVVIASEAWAVAGTYESPLQICESAIAYFFSLRAPEEGLTLFNGIHELLPAQVVVFNPVSDRNWSYWHPDPSRRLFGKSDREYAEQFRYLLNESVRCRMRSTTQAGILMSGGLDSTSVACLAAKMAGQTPLTTISYVFNELHECDERSYINSVKEKWGTRSLQIACDDAWPFKELQKWPLNPNQPDWNAYRWLKERAYQQAHDDGIRVLLTGEFGDHLYSGGANFLTDLLADGRYGDAGRELWLQIRYGGWRWTWENGYIQRIVRRKLESFHRTFPSKRRLDPALPWLTPFSLELLSNSNEQKKTDLEDRSGMLDLWSSMVCAGESTYSSSWAVEQRYPYRDRRLVEFVLALPAYQLYYHGFMKYILRTAMQDILPQPIRTRTQTNRLSPLFFRGIEQEDVLDKFFRDPSSSWRKFVQSRWLEDRWKKGFSLIADESEAVLPWLCASFELWCQRAQI